MNDAGLKRKFNMDAYVIKCKKLGREYMPPALAELRAKGKKRSKQATLSELDTVNKKKRKRNA